MEFISRRQKGVCKQNVQPLGENISPQNRKELGKNFVAWFWHQFAEKWEKTLLTGSCSESFIRAVCYLAKNN